MNPAGNNKATDAVIELARALIQRPSVTPEDAGCQALIAERLQAAGFGIENHRFGAVDNLLAVHGSGSPSLVFVGHTDVVPAGDESQWLHPPFAAATVGDRLYGRGAADMKGSVAAMVVALEEFVRKHPQHPGSVALMLTSDEEGEAVDGIRRLVPAISDRYRFDYAVVGEPSSSQRLGDTVRIGRRGSLHVHVTVLGRQGHVAYPELADNPVFSAARLIEVLAATCWDQGNADFPPTSFQISSIQAGTGAANVIPGELQFQANFRFSPESTPASLKEKFERIVEQAGVTVKTRWQLSGEPFYASDRHWRQRVSRVIQTQTGQKPQMNTAGGTSDGRFLAPTGTQVVELGPVNATIHQVNEWVSQKDLRQLNTLYAAILEETLR